MFAAMGKEVWRMMMRSSPRMIRSVPAMLAAGAGLAVCASDALSQVRIWQGGTGAWAIPGNWSPGDVPDTGGETAAISQAGSYTCSVNGGFSILGISLSNPTGLVAIPPGNSLAVAGGGVTNDSTLTVNSSGSN